MPTALLAGSLSSQVLVSLGNYLTYKREEARFTIWLEALRGKILFLFLFLFLYLHCFFPPAAFKKYLIFILSKLL